LWREREAGGHGEQVMRFFGKRDWNRWRRRVVGGLALCSLSFLAACAEPAPPNTAACVLARIAALPITQSRGFALIPAGLNGQETLLLVDTGAAATMVARHMADQLGLMPDRLMPYAVNGVGGMVLTRRMVVDRFLVGAVDLGAQHVMVSEPGFFAGFDPRPSGLIGADFLGGLDADFDMPAERITLYRPRGCSGRFVPPWPGARYYTLPAELSDGGQLFVTVSIDGHRLKAMVDSGAETTVLNASALGKLGVPRAALDGDRHVAAHGIDMQAHLAYLHHFREVRIGAEIYNGNAVWVGEMKLLPADMLLGSDFFRSHRVWLSWTRREVLVAVSP